MKAQQQAFTLIEVLVSLVILVVGLVGIFNLQLIAKRSSFESFQQTHAALLANDMISRIKLNPAQISSYSGTYYGTDDAIPTSPDPACDLATTHSPMCTPVQTLIWDRYQWQRLLSGSYETKGDNNVGGLDSAVACIQANTNGEVLLVMTWRGINRRSDGAAKQDAFVQGCGDSHLRRRVYIVCLLYTSDAADE